MHLGRTPSNGNRETDIASLHFRYQQTVAPGFSYCRRKVLEFFLQTIWLTQPPPAIVYWKMDPVSLWVTSTEMDGAIFTSAALGGRTRCIAISETGNLRTSRQRRVSRVPASFQR